MNGLPTWKEPPRPGGSNRDMGTNWNYCWATVPTNVRRMNSTDPDKLIDHPDVVGYAGVVLAAPMAIWQGMFIRRSDFERTDKVFGLISAGLRGLGMDPENPDVLANALASGVADALQFGRNSDSGAFLAGISKLKGCRYFIIRARPADQGEDGIITSIHPMLARSPRDARSVFESQDDVAALRLLTFMQRMSAGEPKRH